MKRIAVFCLSALLLVTMGLFVACSKPDPVTATELQVPERIVLKASETAYDFAAQASVLMSDGSKQAAEADASAVKLGMAGEYEVTYSSGALEKSVKVYIYAMPALAKESVTLTYKQAVAQGALQKEIEIRDSFDSVLALTVEDDGGFYAENGSVNYGSYEVSVRATDAAGNTLNASVGVTVLENAANCPAFAVEKLTYDLSSTQPMRLTVDLKSRALRAIYLDGARLAASQYSMDGDDIVFDMAEIGVRESTLRVETEGGYSLLPVAITDENGPVFETSADLDGYLFPVGEAVTLPRGSNVNYQKITYTYLLDGEVFAEDSVSFAEAGAHTFQLTAESNGKRVEKNYSFRVVSETDYELIVDPATSEQFMNDRYTPGAGLDAGFSFSLVREELGGKAAALRMVSGASAAGRAWYNRIDLSADYLASVPMADFGALRFEIQLTQAGNLIVWISDTALQYSNNALDVRTAAGEPVAFADLKDHLNEWLTVTVPLDSYLLSRKYVRIGLDQGTAYLSNLAWMLDTLKVNELDGEVFAAGVAPDFTRYYDNAQEVTFEIAWENGTQTYTLATIAEFLPEAGIYRLKLTASFRGEEQSAEVSFLVTDRPVDSIFAVYGGQSNRFTVPAGMDEGFSYAYDEAGQSFKMVVPGTNRHWNSRFELNQSYFKNTDFDKYDHLVAEVRFSAITDIVVWENDVALQLSKGQLKLYDPQSGEWLPALTAQTLDRPLLLYVPISGYDLTHRTQRVALGMTAPVTANFTEFRFERLAEDSKDFVIAANQNHLNRLAPAAAVTLSYDGEGEFGGRIGAILMHTAAKDAWSNRFDMEAGFLQTILARIPSYQYLTFDMYVAADTGMDMVVWLNKTALRLSAGGIKLYDGQGQEIAYADWTGGSWVTVVVDISGYDPALADKRIAVGVDGAGLDVRIQNLRLTGERVPAQD